MKHVVRTFRPLQISLAAAVVIMGVACKSDTKVTAPQVATSLIATTGTSGQIGTVGLVTAQPISVYVTDQNSNPMSGALVTWSIVTGKGTVDSATSTTNSIGDAVTHWTLGDTVGPNALQATLAGGASITITASGVAGPATSIAKVSGDSQTVASGGSSSQPLAVKLTDQFGNAVSGALVVWASPSGGTLSADSTVSDVNGMAQVTLATAASPQPYTITATTGILAAIIFTLTGI
jgi:hypothetical protein